MAKVRKRPVNVSLDESLLAEAKSLQVNLSQTLEKAVVTELKKARREKWLKDNAAAMDAYNQRIESQGVFSDGLRSF